jgi:hypothetical protein
MKRKKCPTFLQVHQKIEEKEKEMKKKGGRKKERNEGRKEERCPLSQNLHFHDGQGRKRI